MYGERPISIIIVTHNAIRHLPRCLAALPTAWHTTEPPNPPPYHLFIVDNASSDGTIAWVQARYPDVWLHVNTENRGFAAAVNLAARNTEGDLLLLNPDTVPRPGSLYRLWRTLYTYPNAAAVGPLLLTPRGEVDPRGARTWPTLWREGWDKVGAWRWPDHPWSRRYYLGRTLASRHGPQPVPALSGAAMLVRREAWEEVKGMDEGFWLYAEDTDLCRRLWMAGWVCLYEPRAAVVHTGGGSVSSAQSLALGIAALASLERYFRKHHGQGYALAYRGLMAVLALGKGLYWLSRRNRYHVRVQGAVLAWAFGWRSWHARVGGAL